MYDSARARKLCGVSDSARRGESERKRVGASRGVAIARYLNTLRKADSPIVGGDRNYWAIVRILPNAQHYTIARFVNRQDADDRRRALCRFIPGGVFEVVMCDRA
ncbi:MAG: hypothetical protein JGK24_25590 [Microcoleus sp. PH2017_29_MFU_D_A]|uniref:hypothetical protein n=1 Tax=unclassified Microcoleus TaxID=2642155 RepID=UPI001DA495DF|nr:MULTISPECIES: hypothetical protein [unclassified Microcoleus]MCC3456675.1 hypothetical protein [Microcoleus sp. PH2017_08_TRC_O_A]MCC3606502.1 hypothetical protein [Microcoleus sp. PH2017_29_MFU_D_A]MCC3637612.1 hypothetical protein [Microcoleus sp. PH2017_37_MFU_D_B]